MVRRIFRFETNNYLSCVASCTQDATKIEMSPSMRHNDAKTTERKSISTEEHVISRPASSQRNHEHDLEKQEHEEHKDGDKELNPLSAAVTTDSVIPPPPDGGLHAWLKVFGGFFIYVNIWCVAHLTHISISQN
jgi:hypothetical protein